MKERGKEGQETGNEKRRGGRGVEEEGRGEVEGRGDVRMLIRVAEGLCTEVCSVEPYDPSLPHTLIPSYPHTLTLTVFYLRTAQRYT